MVAVIEDSHGHSDRDVTQQTEFRQAPIGAVAGYRHFGEDLRPLGVEQLAEEILFLSRSEVRTLEAVVQQSSGLCPADLQRLQVAGGTGNRFFGNNDRVSACDGGLLKFAKSTKRPPSPDSSFRLT